MGQLTTLTENLDIYYTFEVFGAKIQIALIISLKRKLTWQITFFCGYLLTRTFSNSTDVIARRQDYNNTEEAVDEGRRFCLFCGKSICISIL